MKSQRTASEQIDQDGRLSPMELRRQNRRFANTGGISEQNANRGFMPAFLDRSTGHSYLARFADGRPAPMHLLEGLPEELIMQRDPGGRVHGVKDSVVAGFVRRGRFFTREQAARAMRLAQRIHQLRLNA